MRSVLLIKTSSLGDVIHNLPVVSDLRAQWPEVQIDWVVEENFADIPRLHPGIRHVIPVAIRRWRKALGQAKTWQEMRSFYKTLRNEMYDLVIDTQGLVKSAVLTRLARGLRCGYCRQTAREPMASLAYDCTYAIPRPLHAVERNRWLAAAACEGSLELKLNYGIHASADLPDWAPSLPYVVFLTATSRDDKLWREASWIELGRLLEQQNYAVVLPAGNPIEQMRAQRIAQKIPAAIVAPPSSLMLLASVLQNAAGVVGVDTGLTHLAVALKRPTAALYVATDPQLTGVYGGEHCKTTINLGGVGQLPTPDEVMNTLMTIL